MLYSIVEHGARRPSNYHKEYAVVITHPVLFPSDPIITQDDARARLDRIRPALQLCIREAFEKVKVLAADDPLVASALDYQATRQKLVNSLVVERVRQVFKDNVDDVKVRV